jgi:hypothetical protein
MSGVGIDVIVVLLPGLVAKRSAKAPPQAARNQSERDALASGGRLPEQEVCVPTIRSTVRPLVLR